MEDEYTISSQKAFFVHAKWLSDNWGWYCSKCKGSPRPLFGDNKDFCPNCGAEMDVIDFWNWKKEW